MQNEQNDTRLKIVRLLDPSLCVSCNFAAVASVDMQDGSSRKMLHCKRLDCDNWQTEESDDVPMQVTDLDDTKP